MRPRESMSDAVRPRSLDAALLKFAPRGRGNDATAEIHVRLTPISTPPPPATGGRPSRHHDHAWFFPDPDQLVQL